LAGEEIITEAEKTARLALALSEGVGPVRAGTLLEEFGSAEAVFAASPAELEERARLPRETVKNLSFGLEWAAAENEALDRLGGFVLVWGEEAYPPLLAQIHRPPLALFGLGGLEEADSQAVAIVGSRQATDYGLRTTFRLAQELAEMGICVVSGMAVGIDAAAHQGALKAGGRTIAVLGCGLDVDYPRENVGLKERIAASGAVLTEYPLGTEPRPGLFPVRNRIIAGLAKGVVVSEGSPRSGSLITADLAADFGRSVMAVPGPLTDRRREGPHRLIRQGAALVTSGREVAQELWPEADQVSPAPAPLFDQTSPPGPDPAGGLEPKAAKVFGLLEAEPRHVDRLTRAAGISAGEIQVILLDLELMGLVRRLPGQMFIKN